MAVTVTDDFTTIKDCDNNTGFGRFGPFGANPAADTNVQAQGTASVGRVPNGTGVGGFSFDTGAATDDLADDHLLMWFYPGGFIYDDNNGERMRIGTDILGDTNSGEWNIVGLLKAITVFEGAWQIMAVDPKKPFDGVVGTPPALNAIRSYSGVVNITAVTAEASKFFLDELKKGTGITITGGAAAPRGSTEVASGDDTAGIGAFKLVSGAFYVLGRVTIGNAASNVASTFEDKNEVWVFHDLPVSATFHKIEFVGEAGAAVQRATFGSSSGTGNAKEGSGGNTFVAGGAVPFRIDAIDSNITTELFGCSLIGPTALRKDALRNYKFEDPVGTFTDDTRDANDSGADDFSLVNATLNSSANFGNDERFYDLEINVGTAGVGTYTVQWEYSTSAGWSSLIDVTDGTSNFKTAGVNTVTFAVPDDWVKSTVGGANRFWIRARKLAGTITTVPLGTQTTAAFAGDIRWEHTNAEAIRCTITNMGTIRVRSSAKLKKCVIVDSVAPHKSAALSFGPTDPALDTVRDLTINGGIHALLLQPTGVTTYNLRNIKMAGQSSTKLRIESVSQAITINTLDGGDALVGGDLELVGGILAADVTIVNNPVTLLINVDDDQGADLQNARVLAEAADGTGDLPFEETVTITRSGTTATVSHTAHGLVSGDKAVIRGADQQEYNGPKTITIVDANSYTYTVTGAPATPATGTITSTGAMLEGLTDASGQISRSRALTVDQPIRGFVRKSSASPRFKTFSLTGNVVSSADGLTVTIRMVLDE